MAKQQELMTVFKSNLAQAIHDDALFNEEVLWDAALMAMPNAQGGISPLIGVSFSIPALILGSQVSTFNMVPITIALNEDATRDFYRSALEALLAARSKHATEALHGDQSPSTESRLTLP